MSKRILTVEVVEAKDVIACDKGKSSDPYCQIQLLDRKTLKSSESNKTKTKKKTLNPVWNESLEFGKKGASLDTRNQPLLELMMFDADMMSSEQMGKVTVNLSNLDQSGGVTDKWFDLEDTEKAKNVTGSIHLKFSYSAPLLTSMPIDMDAPPLDAVDVASAEKPNELHVLLIRATGLKVMDKNLLSKGGSSDPLVTLTMNSQKQTSTCKKKNLSPVWEEKFVFDSSTASSTLTVTVDDYDMGSGNDFMGKFEVKLGDFADRKESRKWYELTEKDGSKADVDIGSVLMAFKWVHNVEKVAPIDQPIDMTKPVFECEDGDYAKDPNELCIFLIKAYDIKIMDQGLLSMLNSSSKGGTTDPLFEFELGESDKQKSTVKKKNLNPEYNEVFRFPMRSNSGKLKCTCMDYDLGSGNDFVGSHEIDLEELIDRKEHRKWYTLFGEDGKTEDGHVLLGLKWIFNEALLSPVDQPIDWQSPSFELEDDPNEANPNELNICLIKAYGLKVMDKNMFSKGGSSDPLISFKIGDEVVKSTTKKKTLAPEWNEKFSLPVKSNTAIMTIVCDDYDMASGNDFMGKFEVRIGDFDDRKEHRKWYALGGEDGVVGADIGHVLVAFRWIFNKDRLNPTDIPPDYNDPIFEVIDADMTRDPNELHVFLIKAWGLKVMDKNMFSKGGSSDPLVTFTLGEEKQKSSTKKKTLEPEWNEVFKFPVKSDRAILNVVVDDYDMASGNDFMGKFEVDVGQLGNRSELRKWFPLCSEDGTHNADIGSVLIGLRWVFNPELLSPVDAPIDFGDPVLEGLDERPEEGANQLCVCLIKAHGLRIMDKNMFSKGGSSDPMLTMQLDDGEKKKSSIKKKSISPTWNEQFEWQVTESQCFGGVLTCVMDDYDMASGNDFMGKFEIKLTELNDRVEHRQWYPLCGEDGVEGANIGHVLLATRLNHAKKWGRPDTPEPEPVYVPPVELTALEKRLKKCEEMFGGEALNLSKLELTEIPEEINGMGELVSLNLRGNQLAVIRDEFVTFLPLMETLNLSKNVFNTLPDTIGSLSCLRRIVLSDNQLSSLPIDLFAMPKIAEIYAERNYIRELPKGISVAMNLTKLMLSDNQISFVPEEVCELPKLERLDLRNNPLNEEMIPQAARRVYDATILHVSKSSRRGLVSRALKVRTMVEENRERQMRLFAEQELAAEKAARQKN